MRLLPLQSVKYEVLIRDQYYVVKYGLGTSHFLLYIFCLNWCVCVCVFMTV